MGEHDIGAGQAKTLVRSKCQREDLQCALEGVCSTSYESEQSTDNWGEARSIQKPELHHLCDILSMNRLTK